MRTLIALFVFAVVGAAGVALAHGPGHRAHRLRRMDANQDGKVTLAELKTGSTRHFAELDADKNGRIVRDEMKAHHQAMRKHHSDCHREGGQGDFFKKVDQNGDDAIDAAEFATHLQAKFARVDANGDKVLSGDELTGKYNRHRRGHGPSDQGQAGHSGSHD